VLNSKPMQFYSCKLRGSRFLKMDDSLIADTVSSFNALPVSSSEVNAPLVVVHYPSSEVDSEEGGLRMLGWVWG
jgi:hypothetical protein